MELHYKQLGDSGQPLIILHGLFGSSDNWMTIGRKLSERYKVYLVDQRNHGDSPHDERHDYDVMASDLAEFITAHSIQKPHIIGHSMGGKTAMHFAVENPGLFDQLIIVDIAPKAYPVHHDTILEGLCSLDLEQIQSRGQADVQLSEYVAEKGVRQFLLKNLTRNKDKEFEWKINLPVLKRNIEVVGKGLEKKLTEKKDILFIGGKNSNYIETEDHAIIEDFFPTAKIEMVEGAGHWIHAEKPEAFLSLIENFLK